MYLPPSSSEGSLGLMLLLIYLLLPCTLRLHKHLINNPTIQAALKACEQHIRVDTPFNVDRLESLAKELGHPNIPFVESVATGFREGFWPFDPGDWEGEFKVELEELVNNYPMDDLDAEAVREFRDKEQQAGRWSSELSELVPGMKISPMFVVWRNKKPRVVTDHSASGLNNHIPREEAKVRYDDMHDFSQSM